MSIPANHHSTIRRRQAAIKTEMALFATTGHCGRCLQQAFNCLMTIPATSVEAERVFSAAGILCSKLSSSLGDSTFALAKLSCIQCWQ